MALPSDAPKIFYHHHQKHHAGRKRVWLYLERNIDTDGIHNILYSSEYKKIQNKTGLGTMRTVLYLIQKEFIQVFRNRMMMPIIFVVPLVQLIILVHAATFEMKNIRMSVVDLDMSYSSRQMISKFQGSPFFIITHSSFSYKESENEMKKGK